MILLFFTVVAGLCYDKYMDCCRPYGRYEYSYHCRIMYPYCLEYGKWNEYDSVDIPVKEITQVDVSCAILFVCAFVIGYLYLVYNQYCK